MPIDRSAGHAADVDAFKGGIEPLPPAGKLGPLLASFRPASTTRPRRATTSRGCSRPSPTTPLAVELRHRSWSDAAPRSCALLNEHGAAWTQIDEPKFRSSIRQDLLPNMKSFYYMRLHGRNAEQWWDHAESEDRYNYLYSEEELSRSRRRCAPRGRW